MALAGLLHPISHWHGRSLSICGTFCLRLRLNASAAFGSFGSGETALSRFGLRTFFLLLGNALRFGNRSRAGMAAEATQGFVHSKALDQIAHSGEMRTALAMKTAASNCMPSLIGP